MKDIILLIKHKKYRRIMLWGLSIGILTLAGAVYELNSSYHLEVDRAVVQSDNLSHVLEEQLSIIFTKFDLAMSETVRTIENKRGKKILDKLSIKDVLDERIKDIPEAKTFFVLDKDGYDLFRTKDGKTLYLGDREYFQEQKASTDDRLIISKPIVGRLSNIPSISFSRKVVDKKHQFNGVVAITVPLSFFCNIFAKLDVGKNGAISLGSKENFIYARYPWDEQLIGKHLYNIGSVDELFSSKKKVIRTTRASRVDGVMRYTSMRRVSDSKFYVYVGISKDEILASWKMRCFFYLTSFIIFWVGGCLYLFRFLKSLQELDERKKMDVQNAKLTSLGEMASGIAHEINNPLAVILARSSLMRKQIDRNQYDPEVFKENLQKINITVDRIAKIIKGLKSFSRNADQDAFIATPVKTIVENTLELCNEKFRFQLVMLKVDPIPDISIECRESQLVQVLLNLLNNAYDAVEKNGERWVQLSFNMMKTNMITITVTDSGNGIPERIAQNIMQPFYTTKDVGKGTGLGLSISKGIVDDHRGEIYLDRKYQHTRFVINLPIKQTDYITIHRAG